MNIIITGRIFRKNSLVGYKAWRLSDKKITYVAIRKEEIQRVFREYKVLNCYLDKRTGGLRSKISIPISEYPRYNETLSLCKKHKYTDSNIIALTLNKPIENVRIVVCGALIYGAITDPLCNRAQKHSEMYYEEIRHRSTDVKMIAKNTGYAEEDINKIKNYLFMESHKLDSGYKRFDASFDIATSWQRLMENKIEKHDITLLKHELMEMELVNNGMSQRQAHNYAENQYNYGKESNEYYDRLKKHNKRG